MFASGSTGAELRDRLRAALRQPVRREPTPRLVGVTVDADLRLLGGGWFESPYGPGYRIESRYDVGYVHGEVPLSDVLAAPLEQLSRVAGVEATTDLRGLLFIDTETTGLGGAGAMVFLAGVARFQGSELVLTQYLLPGPQFEGGLLGGVGEELARAGALVSYNGRAFDAPVLESRYVLSRMRPRWRSLPHLDLLHLARRLFADELPSYRLTDVERQLLGFERTEECPSHEVPERYFRFQRTGDPTPLLPVLRHNAWDVLSLAALLARLGRALLAEDEPLARARAAERTGSWEEAARRYESAALRAARGERRRLLERAARAYAKAGAHEHALRCWLALAEEPPGRMLRPWVEAAKILEHRLRDPEGALRCTEAALALLEQGVARPGPRGSGTTPAELRRRRQRLQARRERGSAKMP